MAGRLRKGRIVAGKGPKTVLPKEGPAPEVQKRVRPSGNERRLPSTPAPCPDNDVDNFPGIFEGMQAVWKHNELVYDTVDDMFRKLSDDERESNLLGAAGEGIPLPSP